MINFNEGNSTDYPYPIIEVENCFDEETLENLIQEFPDVSSEGTVMGGRKKMNSNSSKFTPFACADWNSEFGGN